MKHLTFRLDHVTWALPVEDVDAIGEDRPVRRVPRAPAVVAGLAAWRGTVVTVIDILPLLGGGAGEGGPTLVRLAAPRDHTALRIPARLDLLDGPLPDEARLLDAALLLDGAAAR